jgi:hypothetical protein
MEQNGKSKIKIEFFLLIGDARLDICASHVLCQPILYLYFITDTKNFNTYCLDLCAVSLYVFLLYDTQIHFFSTPSTKPLFIGHHLLFTINICVLQLFHQSYQSG